MKTFGILYAIGALLLGIFSAGGEKPLFDETDLLADSNGAGGVIFSAGGGEKTYKIPEGMSAMGILLYDLRDGEALVAKNPDYVFPIASLSKIMTGLLSLEYIDPGEIITISRDAVLAEGNSGDFIVGEEVVFRDLLSRMMMNSSNDAAMALAEEVGRRLGGDSFEERISLFIALANDKSFALGMQSTIFQNPTGLDIEDIWPSNYSRARDLALLVEETMKFPLLWEASRESEMNVLASRVPFFIGGKTGFTDNAKGSLVLLFEYPLSRPLVLILLDSESRESRFLDAETFLRENGIL